MADEWNGAPPGSFEARRDGCKCPVFDNHYGRGYGGDSRLYGWVVSDDCKLHATKRPAPEVDLQAKLERSLVIAFVAVAWFVFAVVVWRS